MKITVSGAIGSGKSTISRLLSDKMKYKYYSIGYFMREISKKRGLSIIELSKIAEEDRSIDDELDEIQKKIGRTEDNFIMDSRLGFHFIPDSIKIYLDVDVKEAAKRIYKDNRSEETYKDLKEAEAQISRRAKSEHIRYKDLYNIDYPNKKYFDLLIDTTGKQRDQVVREILDSINSIISRHK